MTTRENSLSFDELLRARVQRRGGDPLVTYYKPDAGVRIELSARTFVNWVDKTANLVADELGLAEGDHATLALARQHPGHWVTLVWIAALWQVGVTVSPSSGNDADLVVVGPESVPAERDGDTTPDRVPAGTQAVACSLHPMGLGFSTPLPEGFLDYGTEVPSQPDVYVAAPATPGVPLWQEDDHELDWTAVREAAAGLVRTGSADATRAEHHGRRLVRPTDAFTTLLAGLVAPVAHDGSAVLVDGVVDDQALREIAAAEHAD